MSESYDVTILIVDSTEKTTPSADPTHAQSQKSVTHEETLSAPPEGQEIINKPGDVEPESESLPVIPMYEMPDLSLSQLIEFASGRPRGKVTTFSSSAQKPPKQK